MVPVWRQLNMKEFKIKVKLMETFPLIKRQEQSLEIVM